MESDDEESVKKRPKRCVFPAGISDVTRKHTELILRPNSDSEDDFRLQTTRERFASVVKRHGALAERLSRDSDKMIYERLQREFDAARASQSREVYLDNEGWNDGLFATLREKIHLELDRKSNAEENCMPSDHQIEEKVTYRVGNKVICCLEESKIGILYETSFAGEPCDMFHCVLESKSFLDKLTVLEHTIPFFLPVRATENEFLSANAIRFIDRIGEMLQAYVDRREQVRLIKELYGNQIGELYHSLPYHLVEFVLDDVDCKITASLRYTDLVSVLPNKVRVFAWPISQPKSSNSSPTKNNPSRLTYAEDALRSMPLPEAYAEMVLNLPQSSHLAIEDKYPHSV